MNLNDVPDEVLCQIFDNLDLYELKLASLVCRRWAELTFSGRRMDRVWFMPEDEDWELLLNIKRPYRNINSIGLSRSSFTFPFERLSRLLQTLKLSVRTLIIYCRLTFEELRLLLLEVPELQHLSIASYIDSNCKTNEPFPVLTKLKCLKLSTLEINQFDFIRINITNLQSLYMTCNTDRELEAWRYMSGQLKLVHVYRLISTYFSPFFELTFPHLEDFSIGEVPYETTEEITSSRSHDFFRRHSLLRRLSVGETIPVEWIRSIASHCRELTYLSLFFKNMEEGILESLTQLTKLRHLSLDGTTYTTLGTKLFREAIKSLESVELKVYPTRVFLENLFETVPQLNCLGINPKYDDLISIAFDFEFICEKFSCLRRLEFDMNTQTPADNSVRIDRLEHLEELTICDAKSISFIHRNNVRWLTLILVKMEREDVDQIPQKFPRLNRLTIDSCPCLKESEIIRLHELMPSCRIDFDSQRFYPQVLP